MAVDYYYDRGNYRICWTGPEGDLVYMAFYYTHSVFYGDKERRMYERIAVCRTGSDDDRHEAAKKACNEHARQRKGADNGGSTAEATG